MVYLMYDRATSIYSATIVCVVLYVRIDQTTEYVTIRSHTPPFVFTCLYTALLVTIRFSRGYRKRHNEKKMNHYYC